MCDRWLDCSEVSRQLGECRSAAAVRGHGACPTQALANQACIKLRRRATRQVEEDCSSGASQYRFVCIGVRST